MAGLYVTDDYRLYGWYNWTKMHYCLYGWFYMFDIINSWESRTENNLYIIISEIPRYEILNMDHLTPIFYFYSREVMKHNIHTLNNWFNYILSKSLVCLLNLKPNTSCFLITNKIDVVNLKWTWRMDFWFQS